MKVTCSTQSLGQGLHVVSRAVSSRTTLPILNNVLMQTAPDGLRLAATNLEIGIKQVIPAQVQEEGGITVPARLLTDFVSAHPEESLSMTLDRKTQSLNLKSARFDASIKGIDPADFPPVPQGSDGRRLQITQADLRSAIEQTVIAASTDEGRPVLTGVYVQLNGEKVILAATDGYRLAVKTLSVRSEAQEPETLVIPARALAEVSRVLKAGGEMVEVSVPVQKNQVFFKVGDVEIMSRLIEGTYPNYKQVVPAESSTTITVKTEELLLTTRLVSLFSREAANVIKFKVEGGKLTLSANASEVGQNVAEVEARVEGADVQAAYNAKYVIDALSILGSDEATFGLTGPLNPGVIRPVGRDDYLYVIMPIRVAM